MVHYINFVGPTNFNFDESILVMQMCIFGGLGNLNGALLGATFMQVVPEIIRPLAVYRIGVFGLIMLLLMMFRPQGVLGSRAYAGTSGILDSITKKVKVLRSSKEAKATGNTKE